MTIRDLDELQRRVRAGEQFQYVMFWGIPAKPQHRLTSACLSQWWPSRFSSDGIVYPTAEHFMMAEKARLFGDADSERRILQAASPLEAKRWGRQVRGFSEKAWTNARFDIVAAASRAKFVQNPDLARFLLSTGDAVLVEASPTDAIWGVGLAQEDPRATDPLQWKGLNLLGFALMLVREQIRDLSLAADQ